MSKLMLKFQEMDVPNEEARLSIPQNIRREGMLVYQKDTCVTYQLIAGTTNQHWGIIQSEPGEAGIEPFNLFVDPYYDQNTNATHVFCDGLSCVSVAPQTVNGYLRLAAGCSAFKYGDRLRYNHPSTNNIPGLTNNSFYYVVAVEPGFPNHIRLSSTPGGAPITTGNGPAGVNQTFHRFYAGSTGLASPDANNITLSVDTEDPQTDREGSLLITKGAFKGWGALWSGIRFQTKEIPLEHRGKPIRYKIWVKPNEQYISSNTMWWELRAWDATNSIDLDLKQPIELTARFYEGFLEVSENTAQIYFMLFSAQGPLGQAEHKLRMGKFELTYPEEVKPQAPGTAIRVYDGAAKAWPGPDGSNSSTNLGSITLPKGKWLISALATYRRVGSATAGGMLQLALNTTDIFSATGESDLSIKSFDPTIGTDNVVPLSINQALIEVTEDEQIFYLNSRIGNKTAATQLEGYKIVAVSVTIPES